MRYTVICLKLLLIFLVLGCKKRSTEEEKAVFYYANFYARYLQSEKSIKGTAYFTSGPSLSESSPIQLEDGVSFYGYPMKEVTVAQQTQYILEQQNENYTNNKLTFYFNDDKGTVQTYQFQMLPIREVQLVGTPSKEDGITLTYTGGAIKKNQQLVILYSDDQQKSQTVTLDGPLNESVVLTPNQIANWSSGKGQLYLVKKEIKEEKRDQWVIQAELEFYSQVIDLELNE